VGKAGVHFEDRWRFADMPLAAPAIMAVETWEAKAKIFP
jgi:hypothetical protein